MDLVAPTPQQHEKSAAALKKEYGNGREKSSKQVDREAVGESITLTGKVRAMKTAQGNVGQKKQALNLRPTLTVPVARNARLSNKDGATSFHFKHEAIARTMSDKVSPGGTRTRQNAGRDHSKYLERDSAVARNGEVVDREVLNHDGKAASNTIGRAAAGGLYIEREDALAHQENGVAVIYSNISQDANERHRFWELVEKNETEPSPDHLRITTGQDPAFWAAVRNDLRCTKQLAVAIDEADPTKPYRVRTDDNQVIRQIMADHGWAPPSQRKPNETEAEKEERRRFDHENSKGARCEDGRGGHIQNRIVGELPFEVSHEQRVRILRRFASEFEDRNLPYVAVMHAPDHANNEKNWHFHLAYYERPCSRFTGKPDDYLAKKPKDNWRAQAMYELKEKAFENGGLGQYVGQWDFAVPVTHRTKCGHTRTSHPFAQNKLRITNHKDWPKILRKLLAEYTNDELEIANVDRRVDPRRFTEMGITKIAEEHLGSRSAQMESLGIATPRGVENEHRQWEYTLDAIDKKLKADERNTSNEERRWRQTLEARGLSTDEHDQVSKMITAWSQTRFEANELAAIAAELKMHLERAQSRALKVEETCKRHLGAIDAGQATKRQNDNKKNYQDRLAEASEHLMGLTVIMASEIVHEKRAREAAEKASDEADRIRAEIAKRLKDQLAAGMAAPAAVQDKGEAKGKKPGQTERNAANDTGPETPVPGQDDGRPANTERIDRSQSKHSLKQYEVERFMKHLVDNNRRLEKVGLYLVPVNPTDEEKHVITARNYADQQPRLRKLKAAQDEHIKRLSRHILDNPKVVRTIPSKNGGIPGYELLTNDGALQRTFKGFAGDDLVKIAIEAALEARQKAEEGKKASIPINVADRTPGAPQAEAPGQRLDARTEPTTEPTPEKANPASRADVMRKIDDIAKTATPILSEPRNGKTLYRLAKQNMEAFGLTDADIASAPVQVRLREIHRHQQEEIKRLVGFIRKNPKRVETRPPTLFSNDAPVVVLSRNAPPDLRELSERHANHPDAQRQMSAALGEALRSSALAVEGARGRNGPDGPQMPPGVDINAETRSSPVESSGSAELVPHAERPTDSTESPPVRLALENEPPIANVSFDPRSLSVRHDSHQAHTADHMAADHVAIIPEKDTGAAATTPPRTGIHDMLTQDEIKATLQTRRMGPDGIFRPVAEKGYLDPITAAKILWAYEDFSPDALQKMNRADQGLYARASAHPQAAELRAALARGRDSQRKALRGADLAQGLPKLGPARLAAGQNAARRVMDPSQAAAIAQKGGGGVC